ncbi:MAG: hypothetical protein H7Z73_00210, partial [Candidatus Saccharibacteria bacterium]|nr:hypothetical protein [Moraxellaceae bacterium]
MRNINILTAAIISVFALQGCAGGMAGGGMGNAPQSPQYGNYAQQTQTSQAGVITNVRQVAIQNTS